jgi:RimJ/RimL family protein N-acetyltransferase
MLPSIDLLPLDARLTAALAIGNLSALGGRVTNATDIADQLCAVAQAHRDLYARTGAEAPWIGYLAQDAGGRGVVGVCGFKNVCRNGQVEIAYFTFPANERRGYGTAMASSLLSIALAHQAVREVLAYTLPVENASTRILLRSGFTFTGLVHHPEDGDVWRWCLLRSNMAHP